MYKFNIKYKDTFIVPNVLLFEYLSNLLTFSYEHFTLKNQTHEH